MQKEFWTNEKLLSKLKGIYDVYHDIYFEAFVPFEADFHPIFDSFEEHCTNNVTVRFTYRGHTICRSLEELCHAALIPFNPIYYSTSDISKEEREELRISTIDILERLRKERDISKPWCMEICSQLLKLIASN